MTAHAPKPWSVAGPSAQRVVIGQSHTSPGSLICRANTAENARRIAACVNALAGIDTDVIENAAANGGLNRGLLAEYL